MSDLHIPILLAGPILRRVEPTQAFIWVATSIGCKMDAELFHILIHGSEIEYQPLAVQCKTKSIQLGKRMHIHLLEVKPSSGQWLTNQLIGYNIRFIREHENAFDLGDLGLLSPRHPHSIVYGELSYPSFFIPAPDQSSRTLYGSCRKLHGAGEDSLSRGDRRLEESHMQLDSRPSSLFLLGDQIYADDVPDPLIRIISSLSKSLMGQREHLQHIEPLLRVPPFNTSINQINGRHYIVKKSCKFTSSLAHNHLLEFGEYAVLYLLSWSPALWELIEEKAWLESFDAVRAQGHVYFYYSDPSSREQQSEAVKLSKRYAKQQAALAAFQQSLYPVRRLLANLPTYMMFDDHDLTDDWNISMEWRDDVRRSPLGRHVIANGLTAYWAFQGWGNDPAAFDAPFRSTIRRHFKSLRSGKINSDYEQWIELLWDFKRWHYVAPTIPKAVFLDTRTMRKYDHYPKTLKIGRLLEETNSIPQLLNERGWKAISKLLSNSGWLSGRPLIIVSATPVYGMGLIENFMHNYVFPLKLLGMNVHTTFDFEAWKYNGEGFTRLLTKAAEWNPSLCIIVSGDVHHSSSVFSQVSFSNGQALEIKQFTSSPLKNKSFTGPWGALLRVATWMNSLKRKGRDLHRYCDSTYEIQQIKYTHSLPDDYLWKDQLRYQPMRGSAIIDTGNNLGLLTVSSGEATSELLP